MRAALLGPVLAIRLLGGEPAPEPFRIPPPMLAFVRQACSRTENLQGRLQDLLTATFAPVEQGGLGVQYANDRTRTVAEVWEERKANCLSLTAFFVASSRALGIEARYAEVLNTNRWRKMGGVIRFERHVVALAPRPPVDDLVADFIPTLRRRSGVYLVARIADTRFLALYHSNRAVELLEAGREGEALAVARMSLEVDPRSGVGWNILGVVQKSMGDLAGAEAAYRKALALDSEDGTALGNLENLLRETDREDEAHALRDRGESVRRKDPYFNAYLGEEALAAGNLEEARKRIRAALRLLPREPEFHLLDARLDLALGHLDDAIQALKTARRWAEPGERERFESKLELIRALGGKVPPDP